MWPLLKSDDTGHDRHQHARQADPDRCYPSGDRDHAGRKDRLHRRRASRYGHTVATATNTPGRPIQDRGSLGDRDHAGREAAYIVDLPGLVVVQPGHNGRDHQHAGRAGSDRRYRRPVCGDRDHATEDRLRRQRAYRNNGHADRDRHRHAGQADQDRRRFPRRPRSRSRRTGGPPTSSAPPWRTTVTPVATAADTPGRPTHRRYRPSRRGNRDRDHAGREDRLHRRWESPYGHPVATATHTPGRPIKISGAPWRSRSRRTGRPPTSPPLPTSPGVAPGAQLDRSYRSRPPTRRASRSGSAASLKRSRSHQRMVADVRKLLPRRSQLLTDEHA